MDSITVGGVAVGPTTDLVALLRRQMLEGSVWSVFRDQGPEEGLELAMEAVASTGLEGKMTEAVMKLLTDPDEIVRSRAVWLAKSYASRFDSTRLLQLLDDRPTLYVGVKPAVPSSDPDLASGLLQAMLGHPVASHKVRDRLHEAALDPSYGPMLVAVLTRKDTDRVLAEGIDLVHASRLNAGIILANLDDSKLRQRFISMFRSEPKASRDVMVDAIKAKVADPAERDGLIGLLSQAA